MENMCDYVYLRGPCGACAIIFHMLDAVQIHSIMAALIEFLNHFKDASEKACVDKKPALHLVVHIAF